MARSISFEQAKAQYPHRYTLDHVPAWAMEQAPNGKYYAPHYVSDREWYEKGVFPGEHGLDLDESMISRFQSWPMGQWLDVPLTAEQIAEFHNNNKGACYDGYVMYGAGTDGPFLTESVPVRYSPAQDDPHKKGPIKSNWLVKVEFKWRRVWVSTSSTLDNFIYLDRKKVKVKLVSKNV